MSSRLMEWLKDGALVTDGAWGTELQKRGLPLGELGDGWNLQHPERVESVARSYVEAGSQVILTNTFRANPVSLAGHELAGQTEAINRAGVAISRAAAAVRAGVRVVASLGPTGKVLAAGEIDEATVRDAFARQSRALAEGGADALLLETFSDIEEARLALEEAAKTGLPVLVSFAFDTGKNKDRTMMGVTPERAAQAMAEVGADAVGANCGVGIDLAIGLCGRLKAGCGGLLPVWIKPNAGLPQIEDGQTVYKTDPDAFAAHLPGLVSAGASFVGGCCGSNPGFVRALSARMAACVSS